MMNLIQNAVDATAGRKGGAPGHTAERDGAVLHLRFADNGPAIATFFTTKPVGQGTGLGLSISYGIVDQHGGRLSASNDPAGGAVLLVELPAAGED